MEKKRDDLVGFFKEKGFEEEQINGMFRKCRRLETLERGRASENWSYLKSVGIKERKLPYVVFKCPKILALDLDEKLLPTVQCLGALGTKPGDVAVAIAKFPNILSHSVEEKLCPLLAFFQALGISEKQVGKLVLVNPRLISYSIETKFSEIVNFLVSLGLNREGSVGKVLVKDPFIMGYSVERRLRPTIEFLKSIGLNEVDLRRVVVNFPEVLCRDVKSLRPNLDFLQGCGLDNGQITVIVTGYPPVLIKSIKNALEPRIAFLVEVMGRRIGEVADYPEFFRHGLKKSLEFRHKLLKERNIECSLAEMLNCNQRKFRLKFVP